MSKGSMMRDGSSGVLAAVRHGAGRRIPRTDVEVARAAANDPDARLATQAELAGAVRADGGAGKVQITLRLDAAVVNAYKSTGKGWQTRLNAVLAAEVAARDSDDLASALERGAQQVLALASKLRMTSVDP